MMRLVPGTLFFLAVVILSAGCRQDPLDVDVSGIDLQFRIERFDRELFGMDPDTIPAAVDYFYSRYGDFYDIFNVHVIGIGPASSRNYSSYLSMFLNDPVNREVYRHTVEKLGEMEGINRRLTDGFKHYLYHYPDSSPPRVVGYVSRFNQGLFTVDRYVGVGLDQYLGHDSDYYRDLGIPRYRSRNKIPQRIPVDVMYAWATQIYPYNDSVDHLLSRMVYQGMLTYFVDAMYPGMEDSLKIGFTADQLKWCRNNEEQMWVHLVEEKLLFSSDPLVIRKLVEDAPYTSYYTTESPGRAAVWQGWQIIRAFAEENRDLSLHQIMSERDYQEVLRLSRYHP